MLKYHTIGIDCDDVLSETMDSFLQTPLFRENKIEKSDITSYNLREIPKLNLTKEESLQVFRGLINSEKYRDMKPVPGAREKLEIWKKAGAKLIVITGRSLVIQDRTKKRLDQHFPDLIDGIIFGQELTPDEKTKSELCKASGIQIVIEDRLPVVQELSNAGIPSFLIDNPRNQLEGGEKESLLVQRVKSWDEIEI